MTDEQTFGAVAFLLAFLLSGWVAPIDHMRWWTFFRWVLVFLAMIAGAALFTAWFYEGGA